MDDTDPTAPLDPLDPRFADTNPLPPRADPPADGSGDLSAATRDLGKTPTIPEDKLTIYATRGPGRSAPTPRIPGFEVIKKLGRGGIGIVWLVRQVKLNRLVAMKMLIDPDATASDRERFRREGRAMARLDDTGIVKVFEVDDFGGEQYLLMEYCSGRTLAEYLRKKPQDPRLAARIALKLARAIRHAHERGVFHRDLKPQNILLLHPVESDLDTANRTATGTPTGVAPPPPRPFSPDLLRVCDFGLARLIDDAGHLTYTRDILGTPSYMSPEQAAGTAVDPDGRSDVWSLGVILYEMLTGSVPFVGPNYEAVLEQVKRRSPVSPSQKIDVPQDLELICLHCLEKLPGDRYEDAGALERDLVAFLDDRPISVRPISRVERGIRWVRRNPAWSGMVALVALSMVLGTAVSLTQAVRANRHAASAEASAREAREEAARADRNQSVARLRFADARFAVGGVVLARLELARIPSEHRGFEWGYRQRLYGGGYATLYGHAGCVNSVRHSRDGSKIVSTSDRTVRLWDSRTGEPLGVLTSVPLPGQNDEILDADFSPDGSLVASCGRDGSVRLWDARALTLVRVIPADAAPAGPAGDTPVRKVRFRPDGLSLATISSDGSLKVRGVADGRTVLDVRESSDKLRALALSPDGRTIATAGEDGIVRLRDADTGHKLRDFAPGGSAIYALSFHPDGRRLLSGDANGNCRISGVADGLELDCFRDHANAILDAEFSPDGYRFATAGHDKLLVVRELGRELPVQTLRGNTDSVTCVAFRPDGLQLCTGTCDKTVKLWDPVRNETALVVRAHDSKVLSICWEALGGRIFSSGEDGKVRVWDAVSGRRIAEYADHDGPVCSACCSPKGDRLLTTGEDRLLRVRDTGTGEILLTVRCATTANAAAFSPDGRRILARYEDGSVRVLDAASGAVEVEVPPLPVADRRAFAVAFSRGGDSFAVGYEDSRIRVYDSRTGAMRGPPLSGHTGHIYGVGFGPGDARLVSSSSDKTLRVWDLGTGGVVRELIGHTDNPTGVRFCKDGSRILSTGHTGAVKLWDSTTGEMLLDVRSHSGAATDCDFSPDGTRIASSGNDGTIRIISSRPMQDAVELRGHTNHAMSVHFAPDSQRLVSGGLDNVARVWDLGSGDQKMVLRGHTDRVWGVAWSPDGERIATASEDKTVRIWEASTGKHLRTLEGHDGQVNVAVFSPDSRRLYSATKDGGQRIVWDAETGEIESRPSVAPSWAAGGNATGQTSPDGLRFACTEFESRIVKSVRLEVGPEEMAYRLSCANPTYLRLAEEASAAKQRKAWDAVRFYAAAMQRLRPNDPAAAALLAGAATRPKAE